MMKSPHVIFIMGPTATGKTDLALYLHENIDSEIISVDSAMIYKDMNIGTAKPDKELLAKAPHRLIDIRNPSESYSAAQFRDDANLAIKEILAKNRTPVLVGGTGLYFRALEQGLADLPEANYSIRARIEADADADGWKSLHKRLKIIDPDAANRINENDSQRIQRALEVYEITGKTLTSLSFAERKEPFPYPIKKIILSPKDRSVHHDRVKHRFLEMLKSGFVDEVEALYRRSDLSLKLPSMRLVGYRQVWHYLDEECNYEEMCNYALIATRQLAKRQITWCRSEGNAEWYDPYQNGAFSEILKNLHN